MFRLTLRQLEVFSAVARNASFARTAEELHLSAPAVSMQIKQLEQLLGLPLFDRGGGEVTLTATGEYLLVLARKMLGTAREAEDFVARLRKVETGRLTIGMLGTAKYFLPQLLAAYLREFPGVDLSLIEGNRQALVEALERNEVDLAVMGRPPRELQTIAEAFGVHPLSIVAPADHPLARLSVVVPEQLASQPFLVREAGSGTRATMENCFRSWRIDPPVRMRLSSNETIKQAVIAGMGLAFLSLHTIAAELRAGQLKTLTMTDLPLPRRWHVVHRRTRSLSPAAEALRYYLLENGAAFLARHFGIAMGPD